MKQACCFLAVLAFLPMGVAAGAVAQAELSPIPPGGHYLRVGDAQIYYERYGSGRPVVLLHGGLFGSIGEFAGVIEDLQRDHTVIAIALRGHGRSEMGRDVLSHQRFAEDAAAIRVGWAIARTAAAGMSGSSRSITPKACTRRSQSAGF